MSGLPIPIKFEFHPDFKVDPVAFETLGELRIWVNNERSKLASIGLEGSTPLNRDQPQDSLGGKTRFVLGELDGLCGDWERNVAAQNEANQINSIQAIQARGHFYARGWPCHPSAR